MRYQMPWRKVQATCRTGEMVFLVGSDTVPEQSEEVDLHRHSISKFPLQTKPL